MSLLPRGRSNRGSPAPGRRGGGSGVCLGLLAPLVASVGVVAPVVAAAVAVSGTAGVPTDSGYRSVLAGEGDPVTEPVVELPDPPTKVAAVAAESGEVTLADQGRASLGPVFLEAVKPTDEGVTAPSGTVSVDVVDEKVAAAAGLEKVGFRLTAGVDVVTSGGTVRVGVDYSSFSESFGADWAGRLRLVRFEGCWLDTPDDKLCTPPVVVDGFVNDPAAGVIYVDVPAKELSAVDFTAGQALRATGGPGFGLSAGAYSYNGNYATTSLNPSGEWTVGLNSGAFTWSYPVAGLPVPAGPVASDTVSYNSGALDGMSSDQNTQGGKVGPGWSVGSAFIERTYKSCAADGGSAGDMCFIGFNGTLSMAGASGNLVLVGNAPGPSGYRIYTYRSEADSGYVIQLYTKETSTVRGGYGDDALDSYWVVTDLSGTQYWFGFGKSTGAVGDAPGTELGSVWTVPVVSNHTGEPCNAQSESGWCHMTYRWMLDRVVDSNGRVLTNHYAMDKNHYSRLGGSNATPYVSGGRLDRVEYGQLLSTAGTANVEAAQLVYAYSYRCSNVSPCVTAPTSGTGANFPDIPVDMFCGFNGTATGCGTKWAPTFFDVDKLDSITPLRRTGAATLAGPVRHELQYEWYDGDGTGPDPKKLFLKRIVRRELAGSTLFQPIEFDSSAAGGGLLDNRVDYLLPSVTQMKMFRIDRIVDDLGRDIKVTYSAKDPGCTGSSTNWNTNVKRCYARYFAPPSGSAGFSIWHKYRVDKVEVRDGLGISPTMVTNYDYLEPAENASLGGMAWHADMSPYQNAATKSWGEYRGYYKVAVITGALSDPNRQISEHHFYRGMDQDLTSHDPLVNVPKSVAILSKAGGIYTDHDWLAGSELESWTSSAAGVEYAGSLNGFQWTSLAGFYGTAYRVVTDYVATRGEGGFYGLTDYSYDPLLPDRLVSTLEWGDVNSSYGNINNPDTGLPDERCTTLGYTAASARFPEGLVASQVLLSGTNCNPATGTKLSESLTFYDDRTNHGVAPSAGNVVKVVNKVGDTSSVVAAAGDTNGVDQVTVESFYEPNGFATTPGWGRLNQVKDAQGTSTTTTWTSYAGATGLNTAENHNVLLQTVTTPLGSASTQFDGYGRDVKSSDVNGRITNACYDAWSRVTRVFLPGESTTGNDCATSVIPTMTYAYTPTSQTIATAPTTYTVQRWSVQTRQLFAWTNDPYNPQFNVAPVYLESFVFPDSNGRTVEAQSPSPAGGRLVVRTRYNDQGQTIKVSNPVHQSTIDPGLGLANLADTAIPIDTVTSYDPAGRPVKVATVNNGATTALREAVTSYSGRTVTSFAPNAPAAQAKYGATRTTSDAYGQVIRTEKALKPGAAFSTTPPPADPVDKTETRYNMRGDVVSITDDAGNVTSMTYNWLGQQTSITEPNAGTRTTRYHDTGQVERTTDANNKSITTLIDSLGRTTSIRNGNTDTAPALAEYTYDPPSITVNGVPFQSQKGMVDTVTSYWQPDLNSTTTKQLVTAKALAVDARGRMTKSSVQLASSATSTEVNYNDPNSANDDGLFVAYVFESEFTRNDQVWRQTLPSVGITFTQETLTTAFTSLGLANTLQTSDPFGALVGSTNRFWVTGTSYDVLGRIVTRRVASAEASGDSAKIGLDRTYTYRTDDGRIDTIAATVNGGVVGVNGHRVQRDVYTYDHAGNPIEIRHDPYLMTGYTGPGTGTVATNGGLVAEDEHECHYYDPKGRLIDSYAEGRNATLGFDPCVGYTPATGAPSGAPANPTTGPAAYRETNTFGEMTRFASKAGRDYNYTAGQGLAEPSSCSGTTVTRPDAVRAITVAGTSTVVEKYRYDCNGSMTEVQEDLNTTPVTWTYGLNTLNRVQTVRRNNDLVYSTNAYDVSGQRVIRQDPDGKRTLYMGAIEVSHTTTGGLTAWKQYPSLQRTATGVTFTAANHQGSLAATLTNTGTTTYLRYRPYGNQRGPGTAPNERAFLNQTKDTPQSLTYLNQRSVDTQTGTFTTVDPLTITTRDPYIYANANPIGLSDPSGLAYNLCPNGGPKIDGEYCPGAKKSETPTIVESDASSIGAAAVGLVKDVSTGKAVLDFTQDRINTDGTDYDKIKPARAHNYPCWSCTKRDSVAWTVDEFEWYLGLKEYFGTDEYGDLKPAIGSIIGDDDAVAVWIGPDQYVRRDLFGNIYYGFLMANMGWSSQVAIDASHGEVWNGGVRIYKSDSSAFGETDQVDDLAVLMGYDLCDCGNQNPNTWVSSRAFEGLLQDNFDELLALGGACVRPEECTW